VRICCHKELNCALLIIGETNGCIALYNTPLSRSHVHRLHVKFTLCKRFQAHDKYVKDLHFHHRKALFVSASDDNRVKVWNYKQISTPRLIKCLPHPEYVGKVKYSESGLLLTVCDDNILRVYGKEPLFSLCWSFQTSGHIYMAGWSPSNRICAVFNARTLGNYAVQVWDSSFQTIFKRTLHAVHDDIVFASNDLLLCSGGYSNKIHWYHISKPKVMKVFVEHDVLPFCKDVLKIIIQYLPYITRVTHDTFPHRAGPVAALSSEVVGVQCDDDMLHLYQVNGIARRLLVNVPHKDCNSLATCVYPCGGKEMGCMIVSFLYGRRNVKVSIITSQV